MHVMSMLTCWRLVIWLEKDELSSDGTCAGGGGGGGGGMEDGPLRGRGGGGGGGGAGGWIQEVEVTFVRGREDEGDTAVTVIWGCLAGSSQWSDSSLLTERDSRDCRLAKVPISLPLTLLEH